MTLTARRLLILLGSAILSPAFAVEPSPGQPGALSPKELAIALAKRGDVVLECRADFSPAVPVGGLVTLQLTKGGQGTLHVLINGAVSNIDVQSGEYQIRQDLNMKMNPLSQEFKSLNRGELHLINLQNYLEDKGLRRYIQIPFDPKSVGKVKIYDLQGRQNKFTVLALMEAYHQEGKLLGRVVFSSVYANGCYQSTESPAGPASSSTLVDILGLLLMWSPLLVLIAIPTVYAYRVRVVDLKGVMAFFRLVYASIAAGLAAGIGGAVLGVILACVNATEATFQGCTDVGMFTGPLGFDLGVAAALVRWARRECIG